MSDWLVDDEYCAAEAIEDLRARARVEFKTDPYLGTWIRSFRRERVSRLVKDLLDLEEKAACEMLRDVQAGYPIALTRDLDAARRWLRRQARGSERYGIVVSSQAERLKPHPLDVRIPVNPVHWFLNDRDDVRSSYCLEDVATEFHVQGRELDWVCVVWDADFRYAEDGWQHWSFRGNGWQRIRKAQREDPTRDPAFYDPTFEYLASGGMSLI